MARADHLEVPRRHGLFHHHGIDLGDGSVAHYLEGREILRSSSEAFSQGQPIRVVAYGDGSCSPPGVTLRRAMGRLGEQNYNLLFNNCEHFAHWCKTGRHRSRQVESWLELPSTLLGEARSLMGQGLPKGLGQALQAGLDRGLAQLDAELLAQGLNQLQGLRQQLQNRLEEELRRAETRWGESQFEGLRRAAQRLADQLAEVEELEAAIDARLQGRLLPAREAGSESGQGQGQGR
ncbi:MAG: hypothetical protein RLZZ468_340 [Cyanobacteriota bacterium]|jgi:hypothetical protein